MTTYCHTTVSPYHLYCVPQNSRPPGSSLFAELISSSQDAILLDLEWPLNPMSEVLRRKDRDAEHTDN